MSNNFEWRYRYSDTNESDDMNRWARMLYYKGLLVCWINRFCDAYSISYYYPSNGNDSPCIHRIEKGKPFEQIQKDCEQHFLDFLSFCNL